MSASRRNWLIGGVAVTAAAAGAAAAWWRHGGAPQPQGGQPPADFWAQTFERPEGGPLRLAQFKGRPMLLNFWATWCPPCIEELPLLDRFFREQVTNGWQVIGLAIDQPSAVRGFLARTPVSFPIGLAGFQGTELVRQLGNERGGLPFSLLFNRQGAVTARKMGQLEPADLDAWRRELIHG